MRRAADAALFAATWGAALSVLAVFALVASDLAVRGLARLDAGFLLEAPRDSGRAGGIAPMLVSTAAILGVCLAAAVPLGLGTALFATELARRGGRAARALRGSLDVLAAVPSIVFGLFGNAFFCGALGLGYSILSGGLTLACMVLPILIRSCEAGLRAVPGELRAAAAALGLSRWRFALRVLVPAAAPGIAAGLLLGIGRALAETAALVFTSGYVDRAPSSLLDSGRALSVHVYDLASNVPGGDASAAATSLVLLALLVAVGALARLAVDRLAGRRSAA